MEPAEVPGFAQGVFRGFLERSEMNFLNCSEDSRAYFSKAHFFM
jgi:hypothetical protein